MSRTPDPDRVSHILQAARALFAQQGFEATRMDDIAAAAGVSKGALYLHFKNKDALVIALGEQIFMQELADYRRLLESPGAVEERLTLLTRAILSDLEERRALLPVIYEFFALGLRHPAARQVLENYFRQSLEILSQVVQEGVARGELRAVDTRQATIALGALIDGTLLWKSYQPEAMDTAAVEAQIHFGLQLVLAALKEKV